MRGQTPGMRFVFISDEARILHKIVATASEHVQSATPPYWTENMSTNVIFFSYRCGLRFYIQVFSRCVNEFLLKQDGDSDVHFTHIKIVNARVIPSSV